jgi:hypothetical protein
MKNSHYKKAEKPNYPCIGSLFIKIMCKISKKKWKTKRGCIKKREKSGKSRAFA